MKVVINKCYGGFGLSSYATAAYWARKGRPCFFFKKDITAGLHSPYIAISADEAAERSVFIFWAFDIENPNEVLPDESRWHEMTNKERRASSDVFAAHALDHGRELNRSDADLIAVVEELGDRASGTHAELKVVEIPDGTDYVVEEYDGREWVAEKHETWA